MGGRAPVRHGQPGPLLRLQEGRTNRQEHSIRLCRSLSSLRNCLNASIPCLVRTLSPECLGRAPGTHVYSLSPAWAFPLQDTE